MASTDHYFKNAAALPTMPELATRLMRSMERDDLGLGELAELIGRDPSLSVKVLRLANSARYSPSQTVGSLRDAATHIGLRGLRDLALAACMSGMFPPKVKFDRARFWRHGVATAGYARTLAPACGLDADVAYLGGLVLRTGRILMLQTDPEAVATTEIEATEPDSLMGLERARLGCTHADISAGLAERWHFPAELRLALAAASNPLKAAPFSRLGGVLRLASTLADAGERELPELATLKSLQSLLLARLEIDAEALGADLLPFEVLTIGVDQLLA
jgi:HD-like signal output (HDOD) protein